MKGCALMADNDTGLRKHSVEELLAEVERLRAENVVLQAELDRQKQKLIRPRLPRRGALTWLLIVLACSTAIVAPIAVWTRRSFLDTDRFAGIVAPLVADETVARSLSNEVASRLFVRLEMQRRIKESLREALPDKLDFLAGPIANSLQTLTQKLAYEVITSPQFQAGWDRIIRLAHSTAIRIIRGEGLLAVSRSGEVALDTGELMGNVRSRLVGAGLGFLEKVPIAPDAGEVVLFTSSQLGRMKAGLEILDTLNWLLPLLFLGFFAAAVFASEDRRRTLLWLSVSLAAAMVLSLMLLDLAERELLGEVRNPGNVAAVSVIWHRVTADLVRTNVTVLILGIIGAAAFAIAGPYAWAGRARHKARQFLASKFKHRLAE